MTTTKEKLDDVLQMMIQAATYECHCDGGECPLCGGTGHFPSPSTQSIDYDVCDDCAGSGRCTCCTDGICIPSPYDARVAAGVMATVIMGASRGRDAADFDMMNQALDWGAEYCSAMAADELARGATAEDVINRVKAGKELLRSVSDAPPPLAGAMTQDEIDKLTGENPSPLQERQIANPSRAAARDT